MTFYWVGGCPLQNVNQGASISVAVEHFSGAKNSLQEIVDFQKGHSIAGDPVAEALLKLNGRDAYKFTYTGTSDTFGCTTLSKSQVLETVWTVNKDGVDYSIETYYYKGGEDFETLFNLILSTFKFL